MTTSSILATRVLAGLGAAVVLAGATFTANRDMLERHESHVIELPTAIATLQIDGRLGSVSVRRAPEGVTPQVQTEWTGIAGEPITEVERSGRDVHVSTRCEPGGWFGDWPCNAALEVLVPEGVTLEVDNTTGYVALNDLDGAVEVVTRFSSDSALTGRSRTFTPSRRPASARFTSASQSLLFPRLTRAFLRRTHSSSAEHKSCVFITMSPKSSSSTIPDF